MGVLHRMAAALGIRLRSRALRRLARRPDNLAQLLLVFRMILSDGRVGHREMALFEGICEDSFGIAPGDMAGLHALLEETQGAKAGFSLADELRSLDMPARRRLIAMLARVTEAGEADAAQAAELRARTAAENAGFAQFDEAC